VIIAVVSLLAAPVPRGGGGRPGEPLARAVPRGPHAPELWLWKQEWLLLAVSLVTVSVLVAVQWRSFVLDGRDYRILGLLPVRRRIVMSAKLQSLAVVVLLLHVAINTLPGLWLPVASPFGYFRAAFALQAALLMQTVFACCAIVALQGMVSLVLPAGAARRVSLALQALVLLAAALLFVAEGSISRLAFAMRDAAHPVNWIVPVVWFRALYLELLGVDSALLAARPESPCSPRLARWRRPSRAACSATETPPGKCGTAAAASPRPVSARSSTAGGHVRWPGPSRSSWRPPSSAARARAHRAGVLRRGRGPHPERPDRTRPPGHRVQRPVLPARPLHAPAFVLPFFALVGFRLAAVYPASLEANWIFRLTEAPGSADYAAGIRRAAQRAVVLPLLALLAVPYAFLWGRSPPRPTSRSRSWSRS